MGKRIAVVYMAHDGFTSLYTGVGTVARDFLLAFPEVEAKMKELDPSVEWSLYATTIQYDQDCFGYSETVKQGTLEMTERHPGVHLAELSNGSDGKESYGTLENWRNASISGAAFVHTLEEDFDKVIVITVDTPFVQVANYYLADYQSDKIDFVWMPQSTVKIHRYGKSSAWDQQGNVYEEERYAWEKAVIDLANTHTQVNIGYVGAFMRSHLMDDYGARADTLVDMTNSLYLPRLEKNKLDQKKIGSVLADIGVPLDRPLLFSFGRAEPYKGLDLVMENADELIRKFGYYVLIIASPYSMDDPYLQKLDKLAAAYPNDMKIVYGLDFMTPHYVMQWQNTSILAVLSRAEPFGLIPIEARYYNNPSLTLIVSDKDGLPYQVTDKVDGFETALDDTTIQQTFHTVAKLTKNQKVKIARQGYDRVRESYDQVALNVRLLRGYLFDKTAFMVTLKEVADSLNQANVVWCLGASGALYVQGVPLTPKDLDVIVDISDIAKARPALEHLKPGKPQAFTFAGNSFEKFPLDKAAYEAEIAGFDIASDPLFSVVWNGVEVRVHTLEFELEMYRKRPGKEVVSRLIERTMTDREHDERHK